MITPSELMRVILAPVLVAAVVAGVGRWRGWRWAMPLAAGTGFVTGYALVGVPQLPPIDGNDWLFWLAGPVMLLGVLATWLERPLWGGVLGGVAAGAVAVVVGLPLLSSQGVTPRTLAVVSVILAIAGAAGCAAAYLAEPRVGSAAVVAGLCVTLGAAAVVVMSSGLRILGVYGIVAAAALGPVALLAGRRGAAARGVVVVAIPVLAGLLAASRFYAYPGVSEINFAVLISAPLLLPVGAVVPGRRGWVRGVVAVVAVALAVGAVTVPTALDAQKAADATSDDPYGAYYP